MSSRIALIAMIAVIATCLGVEGSAAQTRKPTVEEISAVRACVEKHENDLDAAANKCAFKPVADPCMKKEGYSNLGMADCFRIEHEIWDRLLNEAYKELRQSLDDGEQEKKLREMQRAWIAHRDATCEFYHHKIRGSMAGPMSSARMLRETARRAMLLKSLVGL